MGEETVLFVVFGGLHLVGFCFAALLLAPCLRDEPVVSWRRDEEDEGGGGGSDRLGPQAPPGPRPGGIPLPDAAPARVRLREPARLADLLPATPRRPAHPAEPAREPARRERG